MKKSSKKFYMDHGRIPLSPKGTKLIELYEHMASKGYKTHTGEFKEDAYNDFEARMFKNTLRPIFKEHQIHTLLDYGCGGSNWYDKNFTDDNQSAVEYFDLEKAYHFEPARNINEKIRVDCVLNFDVLEHIFISDIPAVLRDMFSYAKKLVVINTACYNASAILPNGENAHITVRSAFWWKGMIDCLLPEFPKLKICLLCSKGYGKADMFPIFSDNERQKNNNFVIID